MEKKQKKTIPTTVDLRIQFVPVFPKPLDDGNWQFYCSLPAMGIPEVKIVAKTSERAKEVLEHFLYNALDGHDNLEDWR